MDTAPRVYDPGKGVWQFNGLATGTGVSGIRNSGGLLGSMRDTFKEAGEGWAGT